MLAKQKQLGIHFDVTAGLQHGAGNPNEREALLSICEKNCRSWKGWVVRR